MYKGRSGCVRDASARRIGARAGWVWIIAIVMVTLATGLLAGCSRRPSNTSGGSGTNELPPPPPIPDRSTLEDQLKASNIILSEVDSSQVRDWLKTDPAYGALAGLCIEALEGKQVMDPVPLDVINAKYKMQFGKQPNQYLEPEKYTDTKKVEQAIFLAWKERTSGAPQRDFSEIAIPKPAVTLTVTEPTNGAKVAHRQVVRGTVPDSKSKVWVIVHPMLTTGYWVQNPVNVRSNGQWTAQVYLGTSVETQVGELFELRAVADPQAALKEGDVLKTWPDAKSQSDIVEVEREKR
ncbi:MAG TPA: hypothetical protein VM537_33135 [Anaerolineae bacterium]|nr:hypothetical protein [Anaerolineae bacterium]